MAATCSTARRSSASKSSPPPRSRTCSRAFRNARAVASSRSTSASLTAADKSASGVRNSAPSAASKRRRHPVRRRPPTWASRTRRSGEVPLPSSCSNRAAWRTRSGNSASMVRPITASAPPSADNRSISMSRARAAAWASGRASHPPSGSHSASAASVRQTGMHQDHHHAEGMRARGVKLGDDVQQSLQPEFQPPRGRRGKRLQWHRLGQHGPHIACQAAEDRHGQPRRVRMRGRLCSYQGLGGSGPEMGTGLRHHRGFAEPAAGDHALHLLAHRRAVHAHQLEQRQECVARNGRRARPPPV